MKQRAAIAVLALLALVASASVVRAAPESAAKPGGPDPLVHVQALAAMGDRALGGEGAKKAADYVFSVFERTGGKSEDLGRQRYQTPAMRYKTAELRVAAQEGLPAGKIPLAPLFQNAMSPNAADPEETAGRLVWAGGGTAAEMRGRRVEGAVVLMDLDSGKNWQIAADLGAKAVVYVYADETPPARALFEDKRELTPVEVPRFLLSRRTARDAFGDFEKLTGNESSPLVSVDCDARWRRTTAENVWKLIPGSDPGVANELVILEAFYDSLAYAPGRAPGADEALSVAALLDMAESFQSRPPRRSVLLVATSGVSQALVGMREFTHSYAASSKEIRALEKELQARRDESDRYAKALAPSGQASSQAAAPDAKSEDAGSQADVPPAEGSPETFRKALDRRLKNEIDELTTRLGRIRLAAASPEELAKSREEQKILADRRFLLRRLSWRPDLADISDEERAALDELIPAAREEHEAGRDDAAGQLRALRTAKALRSKIQDREIALAMSLRLSGRGDGIGGFSEGFMYELKPEARRGQMFAPLYPVMTQAALEAEARSESVCQYRDTLRPNRLQPWQAFLPDRPQMGGEVSALAGQLGFTLATTGDARQSWGTPGDVVEALDQPRVRDQDRFVVELARALANAPNLKLDANPRNSFATLTGRAKFIRQGELFPDEPAPNAVMQAYQGPHIQYALTDEAGVFRLKGVADKRQVFDKVIIEGYKFVPETGAVKWAIDKVKTGKNAYRVRVGRLNMETDLVMFACRGVTLFDLIEPRTFRHLTKVDVLDGVRESPPARFWYSRIDTRESTLAQVFLPEDVPLKMTLSDSVVKRKMILLNASAENPTGRGYLPRETPRLSGTSHLAARDMWALLDPRVSDLESHGVKNELIRDMLEEGKAKLAEASLAKAELRWDDYLEASRASLALAARTYNDVDGVMRDVLIGVLFYIALFAPFAYCLERLFFAFADIRARILAFLGLLGATIAVIYNVHPAFKLTYSPGVVILAFFILGLAAMVAFIIFMRFEHEMEDLRRRGRAARSSEISGLKAFAAAFALGVSNLRRRKLRTTLTCVTLVILTFTIMGFTSVKSQRAQTATLFSPTATWRGALMRSLSWQELPPEALEVLDNALSADNIVVPRVWFTEEDGAEARPATLRSGNGFGQEIELEARGVAGLSAREPEVSGLNRALAAGRWFREGERDAVILPARMAERLGVAPEGTGRPETETVILWGRPLKVVGLVDAAKIDGLPDLDGEPLTPITYPSEAVKELTEAELEAAESGDEVQTMQGRYQHVSAEQTIWLPAETLLSLGGGVKAVAVKPLTPPEPSSGKADASGPERALALTLIERYGLPVFSGEATGSYLHNASEAISYAGAPNILAPLLISALIVLNTMIGSVFERKREIATYASVGLAPSHIGFLFMAESLAFAVLSVTIGYLLAQAGAAILAGTPIWKGLTANYSSLSGVAAMLLVMAVTLLSTLYPAKVAADVSIPDVNRSWTMPEPQGEVFDLTLPFLLKSQEQACAGGFLCEHYAAHVDVAHGLFSTAEVSAEWACPLPEPGTSPALDRDGGACLEICAKVWLAPFDFGVKQSVRLWFCPAPDNPGFMRMRVNIRREAGEFGAWKRMNKAFLDDLRKQLLVWRSLTGEARAEYEAALYERAGRPDEALLRANGSNGMGAA